MDSLNNTEVWCECVGLDTSVQCVDGLIELSDPRTAVDDCLWYEFKRAGPQYETAFGVDQYPDRR